MNRVEEPIFSPRIAAKRAEQEMARLEHAKLLAKISKRKEEAKQVKIDAPPPPPPGSASLEGGLPQLRQ